MKIVLRGGAAQPASSTMRWRLLLVLSTMVPCVTYADQGQNSKDAAFSTAFLQRASYSSLRRSRQAPEDTDTASSSSSSDDGSVEGAVESSTKAASDATSSGKPSMPCSCDCCQVTKMLPYNFVPLPNNQGQLTSTCDKTAKTTGDSTADASSVCPSQCMLDAANSVLTTSKTGAVDYNRYCPYNCMPSTDAVGSTCVPFSKALHNEASGAGGNGKELYPMPVLGVGSGMGKKPEDGAGGGFDGYGGGGGGGDGGDGDGAGGPGDLSAASAALSGGGAAAAPAVEIVYDMRKLVAQRLRSEAGAAIASGAASAQQVRYAKWYTAEAAKKIEKMNQAIAPVAAEVEEHLADASGEKEAAIESEKKVREDLLMGIMKRKTISGEVRKLADEEIKKAVKDCVKVAAQGQAQAAGLDKPKDWVKVVAARAANPYQQAVTAAVQRAAEYKGMADGMMNKAKGVQQQANALVPHVNALQAQGDLLGASIERKQISNLLNEAKGLEGVARGYWDTAEKARSTIPKWQMAAQQAATFASAEYTNNAKAFR